jgi:hypothetical protein
MNVKTTKTGGYNVAWLIPTHGVLSASLLISYAKVGMLGSIVVVTVYFWIMKRIISISPKFVKFDSVGYQRALDTAVKNNSKLPEFDKYSVYLPGKPFFPDNLKKLIIAKKKAKKLNTTGLSVQVAGG